MALFCLLNVLLVAGCGSSFDELTNSSGSGPTDGPALAPLFETTGSPVEQAIGPQGGSLEAVADDGTRYRLSIPAGALAEEATFRMTPVAVTGRLGLPVTLPFAVTITPSGTQFTGGAVLDITLPAEVDPKAFHAYVMDDSGSPMNLSLSTLTGQTISLRLHHLTTPGLSDSPVPSSPSAGAAGSIDELEAQVAVRVTQIQQLQLAGGPSSVQAVNDLNNQIDQLMRDFFTNVLRASLTSAATSGSDAACQTVLRDAMRFELIQQQLVVNVVSPGQIHGLMIPVFQRGVVAAGEEAVEADSLDKLRPINEFYLLQDQLLGLNGLDPTAVKAQVPLKVVVTGVEAPTTLSADGTVQVKVNGGYQLGDNPVKTNPGFSVNLILVGGTSPDLPSQASLPGSGQAIFNQVSLSEGSDRIQGTATGSFAAFAIVGASSFTSAPFQFTLEGQLRIELEATPTGTGADLVARERKGRAPLPNVQVGFQVIQGEGDVGAAPQTDTQGATTTTFAGSGDAVVRATVENGSQTASAQVAVSGESSTFPFQRLEASGEYTDHSDFWIYIPGWTFSLILEMSGDQVVSFYYDTDNPHSTFDTEAFGGGRVSVSLSGQILTIAELPPYVGPLPRSWIITLPSGGATTSTGIVHDYAPSGGEANFHPSTGQISITDITLTP